MLSDLLYDLLNEFLGTDYQLLITCLLIVVLVFIIIRGLK